MKVAVIPARGGSKRIPRKNIKNFCGKPMIGWSIQTALHSGCFDRVVVSTDDREIARIAEDLGAEVPFMRPARLADDYTGTLAVIAHSVDVLGLQKRDFVCCLYSTAPFVLTSDIERGVRLLQQANAEYAFSVTSYAFPIQRAVRINKYNRIEMFQPEYSNTRSQDLEEAWHDAGQFYWGKAEAWSKQKPLFSDASVPVALPRHRVQDIDTPEDWERAEWMFRAWQEVSDNP